MDLSPLTRGVPPSDMTPPMVTGGGGFPPPSNNWKGFAASFGGFIVKERELMYTGGSGKDLEMSPLPNPAQKDAPLSNS